MIFIEKVLIYLKYQLYFGKKMLNKYCVIIYFLVLPLFTLLPVIACAADSVTVEQVGAGNKSNPRSKLTGYLRIVLTDGLRIISGTDFLGSLHNFLSYFHLHVCLPYSQNSRPTKIHHPIAFSLPEDTDEISLVL